VAPCSECPASLIVALILSALLVVAGVLLIVAARPDTFTPTAINTSSKPH
jgi:hypothetical protein